MRTRGTALFDRFLSSQDELSLADKDEANSVALVMRSIEELLNTRSSFSMSDCERLKRRSIIDYGMPDFLHLSPLSRAATHRLARAVHDAVAAHEPRLTIRGVEVETPRPCRDAFRVVISGEVRVDDTHVEAITFPVEVH